MAKLLVVAPYSVHLVRFLNGLDRINTDYYLITNHKFESNLTRPALVVNFSLLNGRNIYKIGRFLQRIQPEVVHIHQANSVAFNVIMALKLARLYPKIILTAWGSDVLLLPARNFLLRWLVRFNLRNSNLITADAAHALSVIKQLLPVNHKKILHLINFGITLTPFDQELLAQKKDLILSVRLHKNLYNIDQIIHGFITAVNANLVPSSYQLIVAAVGPETEKLKLLARNSPCSDRIEFVGMLEYEDLVQYYKKAKIMVSIPQSDASASSLFEAMMYGCIPVVSDLPANQEWIRDDVNGVVAFGHDSYRNLPQDLARAAAIGNDLPRYQQLYISNYATVVEHASQDINIKKFADLYKC